MKVLIAYVVQGSPTPCGAALTWVVDQLEEDQGFVECTPYTYKLFSFRKYIGAWRLDAKVGLFSRVGRSAGTGTVAGGTRRDVGLSLRVGRPTTTESRRRMQQRACGPCWAVRGAWLIR